MSELRVDSVKSKGGGAPDLPKGVTISGIATAATLGATTVDVSNVNVSGVVTSGTLSGSLLSTGTPTLGLGVTINSSGLVVSGVATAGIVSATTLYGDGSNLTGVGASIAPLFYQPDPYDTGVLLDAGIGITFNQQVKAGSGNVTLSIANAGVAGTVVENFGVGSSVSISENRITINPTADLTSGEAQYFISYPSGCFTNNEGTAYPGTGYTFGTREVYYQLWAIGGDNRRGMLGQNSTTVSFYSSPVQVPGINWRFAAVVGEYQMAATKTDGTLWTWGDNEHGQLGHNEGSNKHKSSPTQIPGTWSDNITGSEANTMLAVNSDGELFGWGKSAEGQAGTNTTASRSSPVQIPGTTWSTTAEKAWVSDFVAGGIKTDGTLWIWGVNHVSDHLTETSTNSSPVQVPGTTWNQLAGASRASLATKTDGTLWVWGANEYGELGLNEQGGSEVEKSPVQIPGTTWKKVTSSKTGNITAYALKTTGELYSWGYNSAGSMGVPSLPAGRYSSPVQIPGTTWDDIVYTAGPIATKTDGTVWSWGPGSNGQRGLNDRTNYSSPVQIPGDWTSTGGSKGANIFTKTA